MIDCDATEGCTAEDSFMGFGGTCTGTTPQACSDRQCGPGCEVLAGCKSDYDPPCEKDPFDIAITPLDADSIICAATSNQNNQYGGCMKTRPSRDGEVSLFIEVAAGKDGSYSRCEMTIDGQFCQSCGICGSGLKVSFNCANALQLSRVEGDERCSDGTRCIGRDCAGKCICNVAGSKGMSSNGQRQVDLMLSSLVIMVIVTLYHSLQMLR